MFRLILLQVNIQFSHSIFVLVKYPFWKLLCFITNRVGLDVCDQELCLILFIAHFLPYKTNTYKTNSLWGASLGARMVQNQPAMQETLVWSLGWEDLLEKLFPCGSAGKESTCSVEDLDLIPESGRSPGEGKGYPLQYSGLWNSMDYSPWGCKESDTTERLLKKVWNDWLATIQGGYSRTEARPPRLCVPFISRGFPSSAPQSLGCFPGVLFIVFHLRSGIFPVISINKDVTVISDCSHHNGELVNSEGI